MSSAWDGYLWDRCIDYIGLRPGEKLFEELTLGDCLQPSAHPMIKIATEDKPEFEVLERTLWDMKQLCRHRDVGGLRRLLGVAVPGYDPSCGIVDDVWLEQNVFAPVFDDCYRTPSPEAL